MTLTGDAHLLEPAGVSGRHLRGDAGLADALLPRPARRAPERDANGGPDLGELLHRLLHQVGGAAGGAGAPQRHHAEPHHHLRRRDPRLVQLTHFSIKSRHQLNKIIY